jgi:hypothetical protein
MSIPSHNGSVTDRCLVCGGSLPPGRPRTTCSDRCRQTAWRRRHQSSSLPVKNLPTARRIKDHTVYQCPACDTRLLGQQRCDDCNIFCRRLGPGGQCPCCDEPITIEELLEG